MASKFFRLKHTNFFKYSRRVFQESRASFAALFLSMTVSALLVTLFYVPNKSPSNIIDTRHTSDRTPVAINRSKSSQQTSSSNGQKSILTHKKTGVNVSRLSGNNQYEMAAVISKKYYPSGSSVVYIANGDAHSDGIIATALPEKGALLYVKSNDVPGITRSELKRLKPRKVIIVGGTAVVNVHVENFLKKHTNAKVTRYSGPDRAQTAIAASKANFPKGSSVAYVVNSAAYADAILAVQRVSEGPLLYTTSDPNIVPSSTINELKRLKARTIYVIGGSGLVSDKTMNHIRSHTAANVKRISGPNRYETAVQFSKNLYPNGSDTVYLVDGGSYQDSILLNSIPRQSSMLYVMPHAMHDSVRSEIRRSGAKKAIIVGNTKSVNHDVLKQASQVLRGSQLQHKVKKGVSYFLIAHPDDEIASWSLIERSEYPVFILLTQGEQSGYCITKGGVGSRTCKDARVNSFHKFLNNKYKVTEQKGHKGYRFYKGKNSARLIFDYGDQNLSMAEVTKALNIARSLDYGVSTENFVADANYFESGVSPTCKPHHSIKNDCGHYSHRDHKAVRDAVNSYNYPNKVTVHGWFHSGVTSAVKMSSLNSLLACPNGKPTGIYNLAYGWLRPPCFTTSNSLWREWQYFREH